MQKGGRFDDPGQGFFSELRYIVAHTPPAALDPQLLAALERSVRSSLQVR